ncbi:hypothetical protein COO60DRAFT_1029320 [Scenedesmus sp. NREL 46B-D3]|nr:hypothetical protein COO60DRAFT_1029320 [Scenedesmus sp. NREL 46B-D3]
MGPGLSGSVAPVHRYADLQLPAGDGTGSEAASIDNLTALKHPEGVAVSTVRAPEAPAVAVQLPSATAAAMKISMQQFTTLTAGQEQQQQQQQQAHAQPPPAQVQQQQTSQGQRPSSSSTLARYAAYLDESAARGVTPPGLTAATAQALRENLLQAAALSGQHHHPQQLLVGFGGCYSGLSLGSGAGYGGAAGLCLEDMVAGNALDVFVGSSLCHIRRKLTGQTSSAVWPTGTPAVAHHGVGVDQRQSTRLRPGNQAGSSREWTDFKASKVTLPAHSCATQHGAAVALGARAAARAAACSSSNLGQRQRQQPGTDQSSVVAPGARLQGGFRYTTLEDTLALIRMHRAGVVAACRRV